MNNTCNCNCDFDSQIAYIVDEPYFETVNKITITEYLNNKKLQKEIKNELKYLVCKENNILIKYKSNIKKSHFKHKDFMYNGMTEWHKNWQNNFKNTEITIGNRIADAVVNNNVLEFQHSKISKELVNARSINYSDYNKKLYWIIDCNNTINMNEMSDNIMITFIKDVWKFENFIDQDYIYLNTDDKIFKINPSKVKSNMISVKEYKLKNEFILSLSEDVNIWNDKNIIQCTLYYNQRGAGCGKTYESIQLLQNDKKFEHKEIFIYLTRMHSAKEVIYNELNEQYKRGKLNKIEIHKENENISGKQYKISYLNKELNKECIIIIGTIDSFMYALGDKTVQDKDYFGGIVNSIKNGYVNTRKDGTTKYAQKNVILNKNCIIIIDEAQDLDPSYVEATSKIMKNTYIDTYIIGDKLQSIWGEHNIHTFLEKNDLQSVIIKRNTGINQVMRFHNVQFQNFVNKIINFEKYNLPPITKICENVNCKYIHDDKICPYNIFEMPQIYAQDSDNIKINYLVNKIINFMENEINKHNYLPNNFMFIFPILSKNFLANMLESKLQDFWIKKFNDKKYQNNVLNNNDYWKNKINNNEFYKYIYLHKSDEGKSINLKESENATRILSIHASKGNGCEVVFLLGLSERTLRMFSKEKCNIVYESLLHVAITRQKKSLYVGLENNNDDISERFNFCSTCDTNILPIISNISISTAYDKIIKYAINNNDDITKTLIKPYNYENLLSDNTENNNIIDFGHHLIRYCVFLYYMMFNIINNEQMDENDDVNKSDQFKTILTKISKLKINYYLYKDYYEKLKIISKSDEKEIPILYFDVDDKSKYNKYKNILTDFIKNIQNKIQSAFKQNKLPYLCPLETVILYHIIKINDNGVYADISIMDVYSIMYCYEECSDSINEKHSVDCNCLCKTKFCNNNNNIELLKYKEIRESIINHYEKTKQIEKIYINYKNYIIKNFTDSSKFKYNIFHNVLFKNKNPNFKIKNNYEIIANSDKYIIHFIIKPQFNKLNFNDVMHNAILNNYMIINPNIEHENYKRFNNKKIITCIITLDSEDPKFLELKIDKNNIVLSDNVNKYLFSNYSDYHEKIYNFYNYHKINKIKNKNSVVNTYDQLLTHKDNLPKYIIDFFYDICKELEHAGTNKELRDYILLKLNKDVLLSELNKSLKKAINEFLICDDDNDDDNDF